MTESIDNLLWSPILYGVYEKGKRWKDIVTKKNREKMKLFDYCILIFKTE